MPSGKKRKGHKMATHKRKKRLRKNRHKKKKSRLPTPRLHPRGSAGRLDGRMRGADDFVSPPAIPLP